MAVSLTASQLRDALSRERDDARLDALIAVASALIERYAPDAPVAVKNEAAVRACGWLAEQPVSVASRNVGPMSVRYRVGMSALRNSGAMALLSPWKVRRAGAIG